MFQYSKSSYAVRSKPKVASLAEILQNWRTGSHSNASTHVESCLYSFQLKNKERTNLHLITTPIGRLRIAGWAEGTTLLLMLCVAMPLKYWANVDWVVPIIGPVHGACFSFYLVLACSVVFDGTWNARQVTRVLIAAVMPFGTFANDRFLAAKYRSFSATETAALPRSSTSNSKHESKNSCAS